MEATWADFWFAPLHPGLVNMTRGAIGLLSMLLFCQLRFDWQQNGSLTTAGLIETPDCFSLAMVWLTRERSFA